MALSEEQRLRLLQTPPGKVRMVLDTDTYNEIDDQFAMVQALLSPDRLEVLAVYACPFHNKRSDGPGHGMELSYEEILRVLERLERPSAGFAFRGVTEYVGFEKRPRQAEAVDHLIGLARASSADDPLYVVAIGAISNVASALLKAPEIADRMVVVWLGGNAPHWPKSFDPLASFNLRQDVGAGQLLLDSGVPVVYVPASGVTSHLRSNVPEIEKYVEPHGAIGAFLAGRFKDYSDDHKGWSKEIWDMAAVGWLLNPDWAPSVLMPTPVLGDDMTWHQGENRHTMRYVGHVNRDAILRDFFDKLEAYAAR